MKTKVILSQQMASAIIAAGQEEAQKNNWSVSIAVADDGGHLLALSRMDDCGLHLPGESAYRRAGAS